MFNLVLGLPNFRKMLARTRPGTGEKRNQKGIFLAFNLFLVLTYKFCHIAEISSAVTPVPIHTTPKNTDTVPLFKNNHPNREENRA